MLTRGIYILPSIVFLLCTQLMFADGENQKTRYVANNGVDSSDCTNRVEPCASIKYAIDQAAKADSVLIAGGEYAVAAEDVVHFLGDKISLRGGYSSRDLFNIQSKKLNPVTLIGIPAEFRETLTKKGFRIISDTKGLSKERRKEITLFTKTYKQVSEQQKAAVACTNGIAGNFPCNNVDLLSQFPLTSFSSSPSSGSDIWGHVDLNNNREYAIMGLQNGTAVVDVTDPENPVEVGTVPGSASTWRDIKVYQFLDGATYLAYAYVTTEANDGMQIIDLNDLPNTVSLANTINEFSSAHNIYISNVDYSTNTALAGMDPYIYIVGSNRNAGAFRIFNLSNPTIPSRVTTPPSGTGYVHDATSLVITDARTSQCANGHNPCELYIDFNENTIDIWDTTDKSSPFRISVTPYSGARYTHSGWPSDDKNYVFVQDELDEQRTSINTTLYVLDISDLASPGIAGTYTGPTRAIDHNGFTIGDKYYMSNYRRGLSILDVSNPRTPTDLAYFDTFPAPAADSANFDGAWGTYPFLPSGNILVSDINNGLFVLKETNTVVNNMSGVISTGTANSTVSENVGTVSINVERSGGSIGEVSVSYTTVDASATAGSDYEAANGVLTWTDGDLATKSFNVNITDDTDSEATERFNISLSNPTNGASLSVDTTMITILSNDGAEASPAPPVANNPPPSNNGGGGSLSSLILFLLFTRLIYSKPVRN